VVHREMTDTRAGYCGQLRGGLALSRLVESCESAPEAVGLWPNVEVWHRPGVPAAGPGERKSICFLPLQLQLKIPVVARAHGWQPPRPSGLHGLQVQGVASFVPLPLHHVDASRFSHFPGTSHLPRRSRGIFVDVHGVPEVTRRTWGHGRSSPRYKCGAWNSRFMSRSVDVWSQQPIFFASELAPDPAETPTIGEIRGVTHHALPFIQTMTTAVSENAGLRYVQAYFDGPGETSTDCLTILGSRPRKRQN